MAFGFREMLPRSLMLTLLACSCFQEGFAVKQIGFSVRKLGAQTINSSESIGPWHTNPSNDGSLYINDVRFENNTLPIVPLSGIYFVNVKIYLMDVDSSIQYGARLTSSSSGHRLAAWTSNYATDNELSFSGSLRLTIGEKLFVKVYAESTNASVSERSSFSLQMIGELGVLPSFLAHPSRVERFQRKRMIQILNWKEYHTSLTGFSATEGIFVPPVTSNYVCSLNVVLEYVFGIIEIAFKTDNGLLFTLKRNFNKRESVCTIHISKIFALHKEENFRPMVRALNSSFIISKGTTYSCALAGEDDQAETLHYNVGEAKKVDFKRKEWWEINEWKEFQTSSQFKLLTEEGKVFFPENLAFISLSLTIAALQSNNMRLALVPGGETREDGISKIFHLKKSVAETVAITGFMKIGEATYISAFIYSDSSCTVNISSGEMKIILKEPPVPMILSPLLNSSSIARQNESKTNWQPLRIDHKAQGNPFRIRSSYWSVTGESFSPKEKGVYYLSVALQASIKNASVTSGVTFEAKIVLKRSKGNKVQDLQHGSLDLNIQQSSLNLVGIFFLDSNDQLLMVYKCKSCNVSPFSGFSAVWLSRTFNVEGFSTQLRSNQKMSFLRNTSIGGWTRHYANFMLTSSFNTVNGVYTAPYAGMFLVSCTLLIQNFSSYTSLKIQIKITNTSNFYIEEFVPSSRNRKIPSISMTMPIRLFKGQQLSIYFSGSYEKDIEGARPHEVVLKKESSFAVIALTDSLSKIPPGFTLSLRNVLKSALRSSLTLKDFFADNVAGAFLQKSDTIYEFNERQGEMIIRKSALLVLNIVAYVKANHPTQFTLYLKLNEKLVERVLSATQHRPSSKNPDEPLKISVVLFVKNKDRIRAGVECSNRRSTYYVSKNTIMSAIFLSDIPIKPGLMLGVRGYLAHQNEGRKVFRYMLKNDCIGCYQDGILYEETKGNFGIPFSGTYLISINFNLQIQSSVECGIYSVTDARFLYLKTLEESGRYEIGEIFEFRKPSRVLFSCMTDADIDLVDQNFITITLLQCVRAVVTRRKRETALATGTRIQIQYSVLKERQYLVAVNGVNNTSRNYRLSVTHKKEDRTISEILIDHETSKSQQSIPLYVVVSLKRESKLTLEWEGVDIDANRTKIYEIPPSIAGVSMMLNNDFVINPSNKTSKLIKNLKKIRDFESELEFDADKGVFVSKQMAEYLVIVNCRSVAKRKGKRSLFLSVNDGLRKNSFSVPLCATQNDESCRTSFVTSLKLQKWQTVGLNVILADVNDTIVIMKGTRMSILMLDANIPSYDDPGPRFTTQPWPIYTNHSSIFEWNCDAVGSQNITYTWNWISRETRSKTIAGYGNKLKVFGKPEESGYYFCTANMNGTKHNSRVATLDVSDTDECNLNTTEEDFEALCHKDAFCINTIGSYLCKCNVGFSGDGTHDCKDINECAVNTTCHVNATCTNLIGSFSCRCNEGFTGNGTTCTDINECLGPNRCHADSDCLNSVGSYACVCKNGYTGNGYQCTNINECNYEVNPCHEKALCFDSIGSFTCKCRDGWTGNGTICEDINECLTKNCTGNATCINLPGHYRCKCNPGFKGNGFQHCESLGCTPPPECTGEFKASWWARSPYLANSSDQEPSGLFKDILTQVVVACCANCSLLSFDGPYNGSRDVESVIEGNKTVDFGCPLYGSPDQTLFKGLPFMPIVESPGIAFFIKDQPKEKSALLDSLGSTWPILAITFLLACLSGVIIWFLDTVRNPVEFPNSFLEGSWEGFWWAFITMTTVGYGDKAPRSFLARLFGIVWILVGLVIISTFTATITTMLTASSLSDETKLYGTKVGVLHNSEEYRLAVKRNAEAKAYGSVEEIMTKINEGEVQGILLDMYIAGEFQEQLRSLRLLKVIDYTFSYGVVLSRDGLVLSKCFSHFLESKQSQIYATISKVIKPLKTKGQQNLASQKSANIFDAESVYFKYIVYSGLGIFGVLFIIGVIWELVNARRRKNEYALANSSEGKEPEVMEWRVQWESGKVSHFNRNIFKNDIGDLKQQIKDFADNWIRRLEELEKRQTKEVINMRINENKRQNGFRKQKSGFGRIFNFFKDQKSDRNGHMPEASTSL